MKLPKPYLSYSQYSLFKQNKQQYINRYFLGKPQYDTRELIFGKRISTILAEGVPAGKEYEILDKLPKGTHSEYRIETSISGVPILAFFDSFTPDTKELFEYKTGRIPWTQDRVNNHIQLEFYCAAIRADSGTYNPDVTLAWLQTELCPTTTVFPDGLTYQTINEKQHAIALTGELEVFHRTISAQEIEAIERDILAVAQEINKLYEEYKKS